MQQMFYVDELSYSFNILKSFNNSTYVDYAISFHMYILKIRFLYENRSERFALSIDVSQCTKL